MRDVERYCREAVFAARVLLQLHSHRTCCRIGSSKKQILVFPCGQNICVQTGCKVDPGLLDSLFNIKADRKEGFFNCMLCFLPVSPSFSLPSSFVFLVHVKNLVFV